MKSPKVIISTGNYNCKNYQSKHFVYEKSALKYAKNRNFPFDKLCNYQWTKNGITFTISLDNN